MSMPPPDPIGEMGLIGEMLGMVMGVLLGPAMGSMGETGLKLGAAIGTLGFGVDLLSSACAAHCVVIVTATTK